MGVEISPQFVSRVTGELQQQIVEWQNRPLERVYPIVFVEGLRVAVRTDKGVLNKCVYTVLGVSLSGKAVFHCCSLFFSHMGRSTA
jgi:transposase-like protein